MTIIQITEIAERHELTLHEFTNYQRMMPDKRARVHAATLEVFEKLRPSEQALANLLCINRSKVRRMRSGADNDQLPSHCSPDELVMIRQLIEQSTNYKQISEKIQRSEWAVRNIAVKNKVNMKKVNPDFYLERKAATWENRI